MLMTIVELIEMFSLYIEIGSNFTSTKILLKFC